MATVTVKQLRKQLKGVPGDYEVWIGFPVPTIHPATEIMFGNESRRLLIDSDTERVKGQSNG